jgi:beta-aspartyl-dipeptidase (metallo-type)
MSSDGGGSIPHFDKEGNFTDLKVGKIATLYREMVDLVTQETLSLETALSIVSTNVSALYGLKRKGRLKTGMDADIVAIDAAYNIIHVMSSGQFLVRDGKQIQTDEFN